MFGVRGVHLVISCNGHPTVTIPVTPSEAGLRAAFQLEQAARLGYQPSEVFCWMAQRVAASPDGPFYGFRTFHLASSDEFDYAVSEKKGFSFLSDFQLVSCSLIPATEPVQLRLLRPKTWEALEVAVGGQVLSEVHLPESGVFAVIEWFGRPGGAAILNIAAAPEEKELPVPVDPLKLGIPDQAALSFQLIGDPL